MLWTWTCSPGAMAREAPPMTSPYDDVLSFRYGPDRYLVAVGDGVLEGDRVDSAPGIPDLEHPADGCGRLKHHGYVVFEIDL